MSSRKKVREVRRAPSVTRSVRDGHRGDEKARRKQLLKNSCSWFSCCVFVQRVHSVSLITLSVGVIFRLFGSRLGFIVQRASFCF